MARQSKPKRSVPGYYAFRQVLLRWVEKFDGETKVSRASWVQGIIAPRCSSKGAIDIPIRQLTEAHFRTLFGYRAVAAVALPDVREERTLLRQSFEQRLEFCADAQT